MDNGKRKTLGFTTNISQPMSPFGWSWGHRQECYTAAFAECNPPIHAGRVTSGQGHGIPYLQRMPRLESWDTVLSSS